MQATMADQKTGQEIVARYDRLKSRWDSTYGHICQRVAEFVQPQKSGSVGQVTKTVGETGWVDNLFDMTAPEANQTLAAGLVTNTTPATQKWSALAYPQRLRKAAGNLGAIDRWHQHATEVMMREIASSNFYSRIHECHLERNSFAKCALMTEEGRQAALNFRSFTVGSYVIDEDTEGYVDTFMRCFKLTARNAVAMFGEDKLSDELKACLKNNKQDDEFEFIHSIYPNREYASATPPEQRSAEAKDKRIKSCYVEKKVQVIVQESGYDEMPVAVSRFVDWPGSIDGWCPAFQMLPVIRSLNFLEMCQDGLAEKLANPPMIIPDTLAGQLDMRSGGLNVVPADDIGAGKIPQTLHDLSEYKAGAERSEVKKSEIRRGFYNDLFNLFSTLERDITAFEASQIAGEKLDLLAPMWQRLTTELLTPTLQRTFAILYRAGYFDPPPEEMLDEQGRLAVPEVAYLSRIALAMQYHEIQSLDQLFARGEQLAAVDPKLAIEFLRPYKLDDVSRAYGKNLGVPVALQKTEKEVKAERDAEAQQQQALTAAEVAPQMAKAAKDASEVPGMRNRMAQAMGN